MILAGILALQQNPYHPHGVCYLWEPGLLWTHVAADSFIALAYYSIPITLIWFIRRRRDLPFDWMFVAFAAFILACGTTHVMAIWTLWNPDYWASAAVKIVTAGASLATAALLVPLVPRAVALPAPSELRAKNRDLERAQEEIAALNAQLQEKVDALQTANDDLEAFASSVSHDLKAPLRTMEGFSVAMMEDCTDELDGPCLEYAEWIASGSRRMSEMIEDLLDYCRLARAELAARTVPLAVVFADVARDLESRIQETGADIVFEDTELAVTAHPPTLTNMVGNLVANALTYVEPGERPWVRVEASRTSDDRVRIEVRDRGIGVAEEHQERIFEIFQRLHGQDRYPGTGIGLASVAKGAQRMAGRVGVESRLGEGSEFWLEMPNAGEPE